METVEVKRRVHSAVLPETPERQQVNDQLNELLAELQKARLELKSARVSAERMNRALSTLFQRFYGTDFEVLDVRGDSILVQLRSPGGAAYVETLEEATRLLGNRVAIAVDGLPHAVPMPDARIDPTAQVPTDVVDAIQYLAGEALALRRKTDALDVRVEALENGKETTKTG